MPVKAIARTSVARNGIGAYVVPCHRIAINFCNWGGSSQGVRDLLQAGKINQVSKNNANIYFEVTKKSGHPSIDFHYSNSKVQNVDVRNMAPSEILDTISEYSQRSGNDLFKWNHKVLSANESVRGIWSPLHTHKDHRFKI